MTDGINVGVANIAGMTWARCFTDCDISLSSMIDVGWCAIQFCMTYWVSGGAVNISTFTVLSDILDKFQDTDR